MARLVTVRQFWTFVLGYGGSLAALIAGPATALRMLSQPEHPSPRLAVAALALGTLSLVPIIVLLIWMYRRSDEYERHGLLLSGSVGLAVTFLAMALLDLLSHTELLQGWVWSPRWWTVAACWLIGIAVVRIGFRSRV